MMDWYKRYRGTAFDPKFKAVALEAGSTRCNALAVWDAALEFASEHDDRGSVLGLNPLVVASGLDLAVDEVKRILAGFVALGMIAADRIAKWVKRQGAAVAKVAERASAAASVGRSAVRMRRWREGCGLSTTEWKELREKIFDRDGRKCVKCTSQAHLHCDHVLDVSDGGTTEPSNLQTLCRRCHSKKTSSKKVSYDRQGVLPNIITRASQTMAAPSQPPSQAAADLESDKKVRPPVGPPKGGGPLGAQTPARQGEILMAIDGGRDGGRQRRETAADRRMREFKEALARAGMAGELEGDGTPACASA